jgi:hypothetical protein
MKVRNDLKLPAAIVKAVDTELYNKPGCLSATTLIKGMKEIILTERHFDEITVDAADRLPALIGTAFHKLMEGHSPSELKTEMYLEAKHESGITITGRLDAYNQNTGEIIDYKTCSVWKPQFSDFDDWDKQGLIYAWLLRRNDLPVKAVKFIALCKDWNRSEAERGADYPQSPVLIHEADPNTENLVNIGLFIDLKTAGYVMARDLKDDEIPPCGRDERWAREDTFAVMKQGTKKAVRVFPKRAEAEAYLALLCTRAGQYYITERPGSSVKCESWCDVRQWCNFWRDNINKNTGAQ